LIVQVNRFAADQAQNSRRQAKESTQDGERVMQYPRLFSRMRPSGRISSAAKIFASANGAAIECILVDYSAGGACLQLKAFIVLPDRFDVLYGTTRKHCRVVWKRGLRIGVSF
jgi:PilZ domain-containing protein